MKKSFLIVQGKALRASRTVRGAHMGPDSPDTGLNPTCLSSCYPHYCCEPRATWPCAISHVPARVRIVKVRVRMKGRVGGRLRVRSKATDYGYGCG